MKAETLAGKGFATEAGRAFHIDSRVKTADGNTDTSRALEQIGRPGTLPELRPVRMSVAGAFATGLASGKSGHGPPFTGHAAKFPAVISRCP